MTPGADQATSCNTVTNKSDLGGIKNVQLKDTLLPSGGSVSLIGLEVELKKMKKWQKNVLIVQKNKVMMETDLKWSNKNKLSFHQYQCLDLNQFGRNLN